MTMRCKSRTGSELRKKGPMQPRTHTHMHTNAHVEPRGRTHPVCFLQAALIALMRGLGGI